MIPKQKRPVGITLLACVFLWIGCLGTIFFPILAIFGGIKTLWPLIAGGAIHSEFWLGITSYLFAAIWYLFYVAYAVIGFGLWKLKSWAHKAVLALSVFFIATSLLILPFFVKPLDFALAMAVGMVPPFAWTVFYLMRPRVCFAFGAWPSTRDWNPQASYPPSLSKVGKAWVIAGILTTLGLFIGGLMFTVERTFQSSEIYQTSLKEAQNSPCVTASLGSPLTPGWGTSGRIEESREKGSANLSIPVHGSKGKGSLDLTAKKQGGVWKIDSLVLVHGAVQIQIEPSDASTGCQ